MNVKLYVPRNEINYIVSLNAKEIDALKKGEGLTGLLTKAEKLCIKLDNNAFYSKKEEETIYLTPFDVEMLEKNNSWCVRFDFNNGRNLMLETAKK